MRSLLIGRSIALFATVLALAAGTGCDYIPGTGDNDPLGICADVCLGGDNWEFCADWCNQPQNDYVYCDETDPNDPGDYGRDWCPGYSTEPGAFEFSLFPTDPYDAAQFTFYTDVDPNGYIVEVDGDYVQYDGSWVISTPYAPPAGDIKIRSTLWYGDDTDPVFCTQAPVAEWAANNNSYEIWTDVGSDAEGCYVVAHLGALK